MRVLYWLNAYLPALGGIQTLTASLVPELARRGFEMLLLTSHTSPDLPDQETSDGFTIRRLPFLKAVTDRDARLIVDCRLKLNKLVAEFRPQIVHLHPVGPEILFYLQLQKKSKLPSLLTMHNNHAANGVTLNNTHSLGKAMLASDWVTAVSQDTLNWIRMALPELTERSSLIENGVPSTELKPAPLPWNPPHLVFAGRLAPQKRVDRLLDAMALIVKVRPDVKLSVAGDGPERGKLRQQAVDLGIQSQVTFVGQLSHLESLRLMNRATAILFASEHEGQPIAALEAGQLARPVVATRAGGLLEVVQNGETGLLVDRDDVAGFASAVVALLEDREWANRLGQAAAARVSQSFSMSRCAGQYASLYEAVGGHRLSPSMAPP